MARTERPIIIDLGERHRSDIRDLKRGEGELAYEIDRVIHRVTQELGVGAQGSRGASFSAGISVGTTGTGAGTTGAGATSTGTTGTGTGAGTTGAGAGISTGASTGAGGEAGAGGGQQSILPVIVLYSKKGRSRRDDGLFGFMSLADDDDDDDRDRDRD